MYSSMSLFFLLVVSVKLTEWCEKETGEKFFCKAGSVCDNMTYSCKNCPIGQNGYDCGDLCKFNNPVLLTYKSKKGCNSFNTSYGRNKTSGECLCNDDWRGVYCRSCMTDSVCEKKSYKDVPIQYRGKDGVWVCDNSLFTYYDKLFTCEFSDPIQKKLFNDPKLSFHCDKFDPQYPERAAPKCFLNVYSRQRDYIDPYFYCVLRNCKQSMNKKGDRVQILCESTECDVFQRQPYPEWFEDLLRTAHRYLKFECVENIESGEKECTVEQPDVQLNANLDCKASECYFKPT